MEIKKSVVSQVSPNRTWDGKYGLMYKFIISFENGDSGNYLSKIEDQTKFIVGKEVEYEFTDGDYPKVKPHYDSPISKSNYSNTNQDTQNQIARNCACNYSTQMLVGGKIDESQFWNKVEELKSYIIEGKVPVDLPF